MTQPEEKNTITILTNGSYVYKSVLREVLGLTTYQSYLAEINLLKKDVEGFEEQYDDQSDKVKVRLKLAILIVETIITRETGLPVEVKPLYPTKNSL